MTQTDRPKKTIGRAEMVNFPGLGLTAVPARIDTGASISTLWVSSIAERAGGLDVVFFAKSSPFYTGKIHHFNAFEQTEVRSSNGQSETRYQVKVLVAIAGKKIRARFTLADRSTQLYPVLIGRNVLRGKFIVDVRLGTPLRDAEKERSRQIKAKYNRPKEKS
jgi:hypothetical protein